MGTTMVPTVDRLPEVLPTDRLTASGMPVPAVRTEMRRIADLRNVGSVLLTWSQAVATVVAAAWIAHPLAYAGAVVLMGPAYARFAILGHEAAHKLLFTNKRANDLVGRWLLAYPAFVPFELYRRSHFAHHKEEFGPTEPDMKLYMGYPVAAARFRRRLLRDAVGVSGWKNLRPLLRALWGRASRPFVRGTPSPR